MQKKFGIVLVSILLLIALGMTGCGETPAEDATLVVLDGTPIGVDITLEPTEAVQELTEEPTAEPTEEPTGLLGGRYEDKFAPEGQVLQDDTSYQTDSIAVFWKEVNLGKDHGYSTGKLAYHTIDIYVRNVEDFRTGIWKNSMGKATSMRAFSQDVKAVAALSGDFSSQRPGRGYIIRNGVLYCENKSERDIALMRYDGSIDFVLNSERKNTPLVVNDIWQTWDFGPILVRDGEIRSDLLKTAKAIWIEDSHPRAVLGYFEPGHYMFIMVEGRNSRSDGLDIEGLARLMRDLGCTSAINLDGGSSAYLYFDGSVRNDRYASREVPDILYIPYESHVTTEDTTSTETEP